MTLVANSLAVSATLPEIVPANNVENPDLRIIAGLLGASVRQ